MNALTDILLFAAIAIFLVIRLLRILGHRTGEEKQRRNISNVAGLLFSCHI